MNGFTSRVVLLFSVFALMPSPAASETRIVQCDSWNYAYRECPVGRSVSDVSLSVQKSKSACNKGLTFGINQNGNLFVSGGCRGRFYVTIGVVNSPPATENSYYIVAHYKCRDAITRNVVGDCTISTNASSCQAAVRAQHEILSKQGDVCKRCTTGVFDNSKFYSGDFEYSQGGPCQGIRR